MKYLIIGTAGHVDHGKSALIKALTGIETDRLKEEKERGISIDLGFALLPLGNEIMAGIVDVPGHERFLKNMLAGTGGIDLALLVVAADEGVMPQTREHLAMLSLYGVKRGVVVMNKIDKVESDWLELVEGEVRELLQETFLAEAPFCRVSAVSGAGVAELKELLLKMSLETQSRDADAPFRLWVDRVFSIKGHGAVVTGSLLSGRAVAGDALRLQPGGKLVRVRGVEWHGQKTESVVAGQRAAINIAGAESEELARGMVLSAPEVGEESQVWDVRVKWRQEVESGCRIRLHLGTGEYIGRLYRFKNTEADVARLVLENIAPGAAGDRGIIRLYSPQHLLAGAMLIRPGQRKKHPSASRLKLGQAVLTGVLPEIVAALLADAAEPLSLQELLRRGGYRNKKRLEEALRKLINAKTAAKLEAGYVAVQWLEEIKSQAQAELQTFHAVEPERKGLSRETLRKKLLLSEKAFDELGKIWLSEGWLSATGGELALTEHAEAHGDWESELVALAEEKLAKLGLEDIQAEWLEENLPAPANRRKAIMPTLVRRGVLLRLGGIHVYSKTIQNIVAVIQRHFQSNESLSVAELRDLINTSRKYAMPIMEYLDLHKYTKREGDKRVRGTKLKDLSE